MKTLNTIEMTQVAGGQCGFQMNLELLVPAGQSLAISTLFQQVVTGQIGDQNSFVGALQQAMQQGLDLNAVKLNTISFTDF